MTSTSEKLTSQNSLVRLAQSGSLEAFEQIVLLNQRAVRGFVVRHLGDIQQADELAQDVFVAAFRKIDSYREEGPIGAWLIGIARNHVRMFLREKSRSQPLSLDTMLDEAQLVVLDEEKDDEAEQLKVDALNSCIRALPEVQHALLMRFYYQSESAEAIANSLSQKPGTIRMALLRIRKQLRTCVESKLGTEEIPS